MRRPTHHSTGPARKAAQAGEFKRCAFGATAIVKRLFDRIKEKQMKNLAFLLLVCIFPGCATPAFTDNEWQNALERSDKCPPNDRLGYCFRDALDIDAPRWNQGEKAKYIHALISFLNTAGGRVEKRIWDRTQFDDSVKTFVYEVQAAIARENAESSARAWKSFANTIQQMQDRQERMAAANRLRAPVNCSFFGNTMTCY